MLLVQPVIGQNKSAQLLHNLPFFGLPGSSLVVKLGCIGSNPGPDAERLRALLLGQLTLMRYDLRSVLPTLTSASRPGLARRLGSRLTYALLGCLVTVSTFLVVDSHNCYEFRKHRPRCTSRHHQGWKLSGPPQLRFSCDDAWGKCTPSMHNSYTVGRTVGYCDHLEDNAPHAGDNPYSNSVQVVLVLLSRGGLTACTQQSSCE